MSDGAKATGQVARYLELEKVVKRALPKLQGLLSGDGAGDFARLVIKEDGEGWYLGVLTRYGDDGERQVVFASSEDVLGALIELDAQMARGKWRRDKLADERGASGA